MPEPRHSRSRLTGRRAVLAIAGVLLLTAAWLGVRAVMAQTHLAAAQADLSQARTTLLDRDLAQARAALDRAGERTARARALTGDVVWRLAAALPGLGATPSTIRGVVIAADETARNVLPAALGAVEELDPTDLRRPDGSVDLAAIQTTTPAVTTAADQAAGVSRRLDDLPREAAVPQVRQRAGEVLASAAAVADALDLASRTLSVLPALLGDDRPRRYLVLIQQTSEARGTGGIAGGYVELEAVGGRLTAVSTGSNSDLRNGPVPPPADLPPGFVDVYDGAQVFDFWQNVNVSPDLPSVEKIVQARWQAQGGAPLDGVLLLDALALSLVLEGSPPLPLAEGEVAPAQLPEYLAVGQYRDFAPDDGRSIDRSQERKDQLEDVARAAAARLTTGGGDADALVRGLVAAGRSGHVQMVSRDPVLGPVLADVGIGEGLPDGPAPVAFAVVNNASAGKLDYFLDRRVGYTAEGCDGERRRSTVTVRLTNAVPDGDLPPYLTTSSTPQGIIVTRDMTYALSIYTTPGAELVRATVDGGAVAPEAPDGPVLTRTEEAGLPRFSLRLDVADGQTRTVELQLDEPTAAGAARVPEQPLARPLQRDVSVPPC